MAASPPSSARTSATISARARSPCRWYCHSRGTESERAFWNRTLGEGQIGDGDLDTAMALMAKHHAIEDTVGRARHYGAIATDALALVPPSEIKMALEEAVAFCIARAH